MADLDYRKKEYKSKGGVEAGEVLIFPGLVQNIGEMDHMTGYQHFFGVFEDNENIRKLIIPPTITYIPARTFRGCINLEEIEFPRFGIKIEIGESAFSNCTKLKKIVFHNDFVLDKNAFANCTSLTDVTYDGELNTPHCKIEKGAFFNCPALKEVLLPQITQTGANIFEGCTSLSIIRTATKKGVFRRVPKKGLWNKKWKAKCRAKVQWGFKSVVDGKRTNLEHFYDLIPVSGGKEVVIIPPGTISLDPPQNNPNHGLFEGNQTIKKVVIPSSLTTIAPRTFFGCTNLETVEFEPLTKENQVEIGAEAFRGCTSLKFIHLPGLIRIRIKAFAECTSLQSVTFDPVPKECRPPFSTRPKKWRVFDTCYTWIDDKAFSGCTALKDVDFQNNVLTIATCAFENCTSLEKIEIPLIDRLGKRSFDGCTSLKTICRAQRWKRLRANGLKWYLKSEWRFKRGCKARVRSYRSKVEL